MTTTELAEQQPLLGPARPIVYDVTEVQIAELRDRYAALSADTPEGYEEVRLALAECRGKRTAIEKRRKDLKEEALRFGQKVDAAARQLVGRIEEIEEQLKAKRDAVDAEKARLKREQEMADLIAKDAELKAQREADEARLKAEREAEDARLATDRAAFEESRRKADDERVRAEAAQREERARLDAERARLEAETRAFRERQEVAERVERERLAGIERERQAAEDAERARVAAEQEAARAAAEAAYLESLKPDIDRVRAWGGSLRAIVAESSPLVDSADAKDAITWALGRVEVVAAALERFTPRRAEQ